MRHVYLPVEHSENDLLLAGQVAECLASRSLYVTWSGRDYRQPDIETLWRAVDAAPPPAAAPAAAAGARAPAHGLWLGALGTVVAFVAACCRPREG